MIARFVDSRLFNGTMQLLIIFSMITFSIDTLPDLQERTRYFLRATETVVVIIFTAEYLMRLYVAPRRLGFVFSFYGLLDLVAIAPFYLQLGLDLRGCRVFRLFRVFRIFKMVRFNSALERLYQAFREVKDELVIFSIATGFILFLSSAGIYYFENRAQPEVFSSIFTSFWWSVCTLTTVGYGDIYPITIGGRVFTLMILFVGLGVVAIPSGLLASALTKATITKDENQHV